MMYAGPAIALLAAPAPGTVAALAKELDELEAHEEALRLYRLALLPPHSAVPALSKCQRASVLLLEALAHPRLLTSPPTSPHAAPSLGSYHSTRARTMARLHHITTDPLTPSLGEGEYLAPPALGLCRAVSPLKTIAYQALNDRPLAEATAGYLLRVMPHLRYVAPHVHAPQAPSRRARVGFVSGYFHSSPGGLLFAPVIARLSKYARDRLEITAVSFGHPDQHDKVTAFLARNTEHWVDLHAHSVLEARNAIEALHLDILVYVEVGIDIVPYFLAFSRLARVQVATWGHPTTSGLSTMDYFVSNEELFDFPESHDHYTEKLEKFRSLTGFTYPIKPAIPLTRRHFGLPQGKRLYLCPNQHYKFHPKFDELILRVLDADPGGMAVLITTRGAAHLAPLLLERLGRNRGSAWVRERIVVLPTTGVEYNLNRHYPDLVLAADVVLDSYPYGGFFGTYLALSVGAPVVSLNADLFCGRFTVPLARRVGLPQLAVNSTEDYVHTATRIAMDVEYGAMVRTQLRLHSHRLYDADTEAEIVREWEAFLIRVTS